MLTAAKRFKYDGRSLNPGDQFEPKSGRDITVLTHVKLARQGRNVGELQHRNLGHNVAQDDRAAARAAYRAATGKQPFNGWDVATLRAKTLEAAAAD